MLSEFSLIAFGAVALAGVSAAQPSPAVPVVSTSLLPSHPSRSLSDTAKASRIAGNLCST